VTRKKTCPECAERVQANARVCRHCGYRFADPPTGVPAGDSKTERSTSRGASKRTRWMTIAAVVGSLLILGGAGTLVALNWEPEERLGSVRAPQLDPGLAGGGLSSREIGLTVLVDSLQATQPIGYQILADATDEDVIDDFQEVTPTGDWTTEFRINRGDLVLRFHGETNYLLKYFPAQEDTANELSAIGRRYGFYSSEETATIESLEERTDALLDEFDARPLVVGVPESDLASNASGLVAEWDAWIRGYGDAPDEARLAEARRNVLLIVAEVAADPTNPGLDNYNAAIQRLNRAISEYNRSR
jgi:hypothetical protein